jgi:hypothetical protein
MSLYKSIKSGKEHRKQFRGAKAVDTHCCNHGSCVWCQENRTYNNKKRKGRADDREKVE